MRECIRQNIHTAYSLHDMTVIAFDICDNDIIMKTQSGILKTAVPCRQVDGAVRFQEVDWDFCFVSIFDNLGSLGLFKGTKMTLLTFIQQYPTFGFSIIDEVYGYNQTKYWGWLTANGNTFECIVELYHTGDMVFLDETE